VGSPSTDEGDEDADADVEEGEPQQAHAEQAGDAAETDDGRGGDEGGAVGNGHDHRMGAASGEQEVRGGAGALPAQITQISGGHEIDQDDKDVDPADVGVSGHGGQILDKGDIRIELSSDFCSAT
jgi:hypothetical protein